MRATDRLPMTVESGVVVATESTGTDACYRTWIECAELARRVRAGQFVMVRLARADFPYLGRPFSVADVCPEHPDRFAIAYTAVGQGTRMLAVAPVGATVTCVGTLGNWFDLAPASSHVFVAGGIGSAPFPLLSRQLREHDPAGRQVMYLGARNAGGLHLARELAALDVEVRTATEDGSAGPAGESFRGTCVQHLAHDADGGALASDARVYACGPNPMFAALADAMVDRDHVVQASLEEHMACGFGACNACVVPIRDALGEDAWHYELICLKGPVFDIHRVGWQAALGH